ncbi:SphA family protein [Metapseudomonas furukawaii]|uniref:Protein involved in meta-pathway of phenol degradation n=1 Tax=Metapseudomonas furukawaii TaxID=1149133 RepID=A0AAD1BXL6_METFU|nr:transporter [Pseudomonas furukawaii]ELS26338.1 Protein involved in meta-pathway of phenol degradation [Pseudomonas furukawaii]BAU73148.1 protein involved in meta-pathway of phenol degradation [Pseudomonas furukawaii]
MTRTNKALQLCVLASGLVAGQASQAYDLPVVNLGLTTFLDGGLPAGPGWYIQQYFQDYRADHLKDQRGDDLPLPRQDLHYQVAVTQLSYLSDLRLGNASLGLNAVLPVVTRMDLDDGLNNAALKAQDGVGDLLVGPFIQFDPIMGPDGPRFVHRIELQVNLPTGKYDEDQAINPGANAWSFNPYWAATYWFTPKWSASLRAHYLYNGKNEDPNYSYGGADDLQAGQAVHANFATEYAVTPQLRLGINGYWLNQFTDTRIDGHEVSGRRERVWAIGPGAMYSFSQEDHLVVNAYVEQDVENRPEGSRVQVRYVHHF